MQYDEVKELIAIFEKSDLNDMEVQLDNARIRLNRGAVSPWMAAIPPVMASQQAAVPAPQASAVPQPVMAAPSFGEASQQPSASSVPEEISPVSEEEGVEVIKAPIVGTFYQSSAPGEEPFVKAGDTISKGDVVCIIEAMKFMNEVNSELGGTVLEVMVKDGDFVEYGQALFRVKTLQ